jgi:hypothetical protein
MNIDHFMTTMQAYRNRRPFRPFTVTLVNGDRFEIDFPDALVVREGLGMFAATGGVPHIFDYEGVVDVFGDLTDKPAGEATAG